MYNDFWDQDPNNPDDYRYRDRPYPTGSTAPDPSLNTTPEDDTPRVIPVPGPTTAPPSGTHPYDPTQDPPKPADPGDGRVYIWMGDHWGLTEPANAPYPSSGQPRTGGDMPQMPTSFGGWPEPSYPDYENVPAFTPRNATFSFEGFSPSSWQDAENEPGYDASRTQLKKQIEASNAFRGMARSGMTIGDLYTNLDALGQQNFGTFDARRFRNWEGNRDLAATKFGLEYGVDRDEFDRMAANIGAKNNYRFNVSDRTNTQKYGAASQDFQADLQRWLEQVRSLTALGTAGAT